MSNDRTRLFEPARLQGECTMTLICKIVRKALATGYLTVEAEELLRQQLQMTKYGLEDFEAFITLQKEVMEGRVKQQALELLRSRQCSATA
jgi:hypothetical protein